MLQRRVYESKTCYKEEYTSQKHVTKKGIRVKNMLQRRVTKYTHTSQKTLCFASVRPVCLPKNCKQVLASLFAL